jgi:hypothetical protein
VADPGGVVFVPAFIGLGMPHEDRSARGTLLGGLGAGIWPHVGALPPLTGDTTIFDPQRRASERGRAGGMAQGHRPRAIGPSESETTKDEGRMLPFRPSSLVIRQYARVLNMELWQ